MSLIFTQIYSVHYKVFPSISDEATRQEIYFTLVAANNFGILELETGEIFSGSFDDIAVYQRRIKNTALARVTMHHRGGVYGGAKLVQAG